MNLLAYLMLGIFGFCVLVYLVTKAIYNRNPRPTIVSTRDNVWQPGSTVIINDSGDDFTESQAYILRLEERVEELEQYNKTLLDSIDRRDTERIRRMQLERTNS